MKPPSLFWSQPRPSVPSTNTCNVC
jgi:hypothetical protein